MKCLSIRPDFADEIVAGEKTKEFRTWKTDYRGDILIHANKNLPKEAEGLLVSGYAIAVVNLFDIEERKTTDYVWLLKNVRYIKPIALKGQQRLFNVDDNLIEYLDISDFNELLIYWDSLGLIDINLFEEV